MPMEWTLLVGPLLNMAFRVAEYAGNALRYRKKCQLLQSRVQLIAANLRALEQAQWTSDPPATEYTLACLRRVLGRAEDLVLSCQRKKRAFDFFKAFKNKGEFSFVNKQINHIMESFHLANHTLILLGYSDRIFMVVLDTLIEDGACSLLPQDRKASLLDSIRGLPHSDNMSPEKKKTLERIKRELRLGSHRRQWDAASASSADGGQNQNDRVLKQVADIAMAIVEEAEEVSHNRVEVQRVAQLAQKVVYLMPHLQSPLLRTDETMQLVTSLKDNLKGALDTVKRSKQPVHCGAPALMASSFLKQQAKRTAELGNSIEQGYQTLTLKVVHKIANNA
ncbi:unnamed protein product [Urochloa humidicola]